MPDVELRQVFQDMHSEGKLLTADESAEVLAGVLEEDRFESGSHIDFYDVSKL